MKREEITYQTNTGEFVAEKLLPCPFCGGEPEFVTIGNDYTKSRKAEIKCTKCFCKRTTGAIHNNLEWCGRKAIELWNKRTAEHPLPPAEGAEEIIDDAETILHSHPYLKVWTETLFDSEMKVCSIEQAIWAMERFATLHAQQMADKMKEANQFILDIAKIFGIETDGVGYDGLQLSIDDFKEVADKMVEDRLRDELIAYDKFLSNTYWGVGHIVKRDEAVDEYLKQRQP